MYPNNLFEGIFPDNSLFSLTLYDICILIGIVAVFFLADRMTVKRGFSVTLQKIVIITAVIAIVVGYGSAVLFQAYYNFEATGVFAITATTGATFFGGLIGGAAVFLIVWFLFAGRFCKDKDEPKKRFADIADIAACCIPLAHGVGRIGCFFAGCCHGGETDAWYGVMMNGQKVVPLQLVEAAFLLALTAALLALYYKNTGAKKFPLLPTYCLVYGVWRFFIEYARGDYRGETFVSFLTPSQLIAVLLVAIGAAYFAIWWWRRKAAAKPLKTQETTEEIEETKEK